MLGYCADVVCALPAELFPSLSHPLVKIARGLFRIQTFSGVCVASLKLPSEEQVLLGVQFVTFYIVEYCFLYTFRKSLHSGRAQILSFAILCELCFSFDL